MNRCISVIAIIITAIITLRYRKQEEKKAELLELLSSYRNAIDHNIISCVSDLKGKILIANQKFCEISKYSKKELEGKSHNIVNSGYHPKEFFATMWKTITEGKVWHGEIKNKAKDGTYYWVDAVILPINNFNGTKIQYLALQTVITEKKQLVEDRLNLREQLIIAQETERARIAQDLHDGVGQILIATNMNINAIKETCSDHKEGMELITNIGTLLVNSIKEVRAISHNLSCKAIQLGLESGIKETIGNVNSSCKIIFESTIANKRFSEKVEINIYRALQEIINNTLKHAQASELTISIQFENNNLIIHTKDDGVGFDLENINQKTGIGLSGLRNRIEMIGGHLKINSSNDKGTEYTIEVNNLEVLKVA
jgi:PAS domain S-box-containing protein